MSFQKISSVPARRVRSLRRRAVGDRGQVVPLLVVLLVVGLGCIVVLGRVGAAAVDRADAQTAADAAALAGVQGGEPAAADAARRNGGELVRFVVVDGVVEVEVELQEASAAARATIDVAGVVPGT